MRFIENGPSIPDELLLARDEGRVVFFCGAGVSRARAHLPDFFGLASRVIERLRVPADSAACRILHEVQEIESRVGVGGLVSADRIFGLLERDFSTDDIDSSVAEILRRPAGTDLWAHNILLRLSRTREGRVKLVTTNFDRLFERCDPTLEVWHPPRLPDPNRHDEFGGIVHLHGIVNKDYSGSHGDGFVLSSSEFGRAYLADGWATSFFRSVIDRYVVVFLGYQADDPPVQYLLEALNKSAGALKGVYAFQSGPAEDAVARWQHKGVRAIPYDHSSEHVALWDTLDAWANRADDPDEWVRSKVEGAAQGPEALRPHERGQIVHIISTLEGSREFSRASAPPPAEWLCVFDPHQRFATPDNTRRRSFEQDGPLFDPFAVYGLDDDPAPKPHDPDNHFERRETPPTVLDCLALNSRDRISLRDGNFPGIRGPWSLSSPRLAPRLWELGHWIGRIAHQPTAAWWAAGQSGLHPEVQEQIEWSLNRNNAGAPSTVKDCWRYLFEAWSMSGRNPDYDRHRFPTDAEGWNIARVRCYGKLDRPFLTAGRSWRSGQPPSSSEEFRSSDLVRLDVKYPNIRVSVPNTFVREVVIEARKNLELAVQLETELGGYGLGSISPIAPDENREGHSYERTRGLSACVLAFASLFERLSILDAAAAKREFESWRPDDNVFGRLRLWVAGISQVVEPSAFLPVIRSLSDDVFWGSHHQRDLLLVLSKRWPDLTVPSRRAIQERIMAGAPKWESESPAEHKQRRAWQALSRFEWLVSNGCELTFDWSKRRARLQRDAPEWKSAYGPKAADSIESRGGAVKTDTTYAALLDTPIGDVLSRADELRGRTEDFLIENDPFMGLSKERPVRAFQALVGAAKKGNYPEVAWSTFLNPEARKGDSEPFRRQIAKRLASYPNEMLSNNLRAVSDWLLAASSALSREDRETFECLFNRLIDALPLNPEDARSGIVRGNEGPDWTMEAINAPVGKLAQAVLNDPRTEDRKPGRGFSLGWLHLCDRLLGLDGDLKRHALVIFGHQMTWFFAIDVEWTERRLLSILDSGPDEDKNALWSGFLWAARVPQIELFKRMKASVLSLAKKRPLRKQGYEEVLAGFILAGWARGGQERLVSDTEFHELLLHSDDEFRSHVLWTLERWTTEKDDGAESNFLPFVSEFLKNVWPRQRAVKTSTASARLFDLAFSNEEKFAEWADLILPLLVPVQEQLLMPKLSEDENDNIVGQYPEKTLSLLHAVLPDDVAMWPYRIEAVLQQIGAADETLRADDRLVELWRKWNSR